MKQQHWHEAEDARGWLQDKPRCNATLYLLTRLPFLDIRVLQQLAGQHGPASMYRSVARLQRAGLIASIQPPVYAPNAPHLFYLTDLGLATIALDLGSDPRHLAARLHLRGSDLAKCLLQLRHMLNLYELLGALAASHPGTPILLTWERPWRRCVTRPNGTSAVSVTVPAYAVLSWNGVIGSYLLLPDAGMTPLHLQRATLARLLMLRRAWNSQLPFLLIATTDRDRMRAWERLLEELGTAQRGGIVRWDDLPHGLTNLPVAGGDSSLTNLACSLRLTPLHARSPSNPIPRIVGDELTNSALGATRGRANVALVVTPTEYRLLEVIGFHPFLTETQLSDVLGYSAASIRQRLNRLLELALIRHLGVDEAGEEASPAMPELTMDGLKLVAAQLGLSVAMAVRALGLVGGGPNNPVGSRRKLVGTLTHTRGVDELFVRLYRQASKRRTVGYDEEVTEWQNAAACSRRHLRPDGYGVYRRGTHYDGFFLEYDRGTMNARDYFKKFGAYYRYAVNGRFARDYNSYPAILVITSDNASEERIARVARAVAVGHPGRLPLLLTCQWRINDSSNWHGLLGPIWREPETAFHDRRHWLSHIGLSHS